MNNNLLAPGPIGNVRTSPDSEVGPPIPAVRKATTSDVGGELETVKPTSMLDSKAFPTFMTVALSANVEPTIAWESNIDPFRLGKLIRPVIMSRDATLFSGFRSKPSGSTSMLTV